MANNHHEPTLPIPSKLSREITAVIDEITKLGDKLIVLDRRFRALQARPSVVAVDDLGPAITAGEATSSVRGWLGCAELALLCAAGELGEAHAHASRLKLTDSAAEHTLSAMRGPKSVTPERNTANV
ncbi:hypothetical protein [Nocardia vulneris]|uniref:DUF222 domain-containing protein n=1 Tax=Nocardia vulneris TaxID=1141657 RepID=A0ABR4Z5W4_9NOCA|nr:hypothetical protein [Nocardia vulneris]KIA60554.1 hypothetical protein FG87_36160 [Nocardia vulneris]